MYSLPLLDIIGKCPQASIYRLLIGSSKICSSFVLMGGGISSISSSSGATLNITFFMFISGGVFFVVDHKPWEDWTMCTFIALTSRQKYLAAFEYVRSGHISKFPLFIALRHVDLNGNHDASCVYCTSVSTLGRLYALYTEIVAFLPYRVYCSRSFLFSIREKRHSFGISLYRHTVRMGLPPGENTVTSWLVNKTVQSASHMGLTSTRVVVQNGMIYPAVRKSAANCGIGSAVVAHDLSTFLVSVTTLLCGVLVLGGPFGAVE